MLCLTSYTFVYIYTHPEIYMFQCCEHCDLQHKQSGVPMLARGCWSIKKTHPSEQARVPGLKSCWSSIPRDARWCSGSTSPSPRQEQRFPWDVPRWAAGYGCQVNIGIGQAGEKFRGVPWPPSETAWRADDQPSFFPAPHFRSWVGWAGKRGCHRFTQPSSLHLPLLYGLPAVSLQKHISPR